MAKKLTEIIDITNPQFLREYEGKYIYAPEEKQTYKISGGQIAPFGDEAFMREQGHALSSSGQIATFSPTAGLLNRWDENERGFKYFRQLDPNNPMQQMLATGKSYTGEPVRSGFDITPGQASPEQIAKFNAGIGEYAPTFSAASAGSVAGAQNLVFQNGITIDKNTGQIIGVGDLTGRQAPAVSGTGWYDEVTGKDTPVGVGTPRPPAAAGTQQPSAQNLLQLALDRVASGARQSADKTNIDYAKSRGLLATLTSPEGKKQVVAVGSQKAGSLLSAGWTLGDKLGGGTQTAIIPDNLKTATPLKIEGATASVSSSSAIAASAEQTSKSIDDYLKEFKKPASELDQQIKDLIGNIGAGLTSLEGRGAAQLAEEQARNVETLKNNLSDANASLQNKLAEIKVLDAQYQKEFVDVEGKPITMARMQGQTAQLYKIYQAQKNVLVSEAGLLQAQALGMQGKLTEAQSAANRAVNLKYADQQDKVNLQLKQLELLQGQLTKEEQHYADALKLLLQDKQQVIVNKKAEEKAAEKAKLAKIDMENKLAQAGYKYVSTPAERDALKAQGYDILEQTDDLGIKRTYAKALAAIKGTAPKAPDEVSDFEYARQTIDANVNANPNINDAELKAGLLEMVNKKEIKLSVTDINSLIAERKEKQIAEAEANKPQSFSEDWFKAKIEIARSNDFSDAEIMDYIIKNFDINELFKTAKEAGFASWLTGKKTDIKRYIESLL